MRSFESGFGNEVRGIGKLWGGGRVVFVIRMGSQVGRIDLLEGNYQFIAE